jgi:protein TonB
MLDASARNLGRDVQQPKNTFAGAAGNKFTNAVSDIGEAMLYPSRVLATAAFILAARGAHSEDFVWRYGRIIGLLTVPPEFSADTYNYKEGIVTTLHYSDGSKILLQSGGMYRIPMFQGPDFQLDSSTESPTKTIRVGRIKDSALCWREDNFKMGPVNGRAFPALFPPNIGYVGVPPERRAEFDRALDSFSLATDRPAGQPPQRMQNAGIVSKREPVYPEAARKSGLQGAVWLDAVIGKDGYVTSVQEISGNPVLVGAAKDAVMQWVYRPTTLNGEPLEVVITICVPFVLRQSKQTPSPCTPPKSGAHYR